MFRGMVQTLFGQNSRRSSGIRPTSRRQHSRLRLEQLEDRSVPAVLTVGQGEAYATLGAAAAAAKSGDTISIDPVTLKGSDAYADISTSNLTIEGAGSTRTVLDATGYDLPNRKGIITLESTANNITIRNIEFLGAHDPNGLDKNWAGVREQASGLNIENCYFHGNDDGLLTGAGATSDIVITNSEFASNGYGNGYSHNIYVGDVRSFSIKYS